jgi:hypothetical protein
MTCRYKAVYETLKNLQVAAQVQLSFCLEVGRGVNSSVLGNFLKDAWDLSIDWHPVNNVRF